MSLLPQWWRTHFLRAELLLAFFITVGLILFSEQQGGAAFIDPLLHGNRGALYGTLASIFGSLLGFTIAAASIVLASISSPRLRIVRQSRNAGDLWRIFSSTIRVLAVATLISLMGLLLDRDAAPSHWIFYLLLFVFSLACLRLARTLWVLEKTILLVASESDR